MGKKPICQMLWMAAAAVSPPCWTSALQLRDSLVVQWLRLHEKMKQTTKNQCYYYIVVGQYQNWVEVKKAGFQAGEETGRQNLACVRASGGRKNEGLRFMIRH